MSLLRINLIYFTHFSKVKISKFSTFSVLLVKKKPNLTIETNPSTGNEGLDAEKEWRNKSSFCEHDKLFKYLADENDNTNPMLCDYTGDSEDVAGQSSKDQSDIPKKHPAVKGEGDWAHICDNCHAVICKNCHVEYPPEENTPVGSPGGYVERKELNISNDKQKDKTIDNSSKSSILDDFADTSSELPDYIGGDD
jgi:hypothetical protein